MKLAIVLCLIGSVLAQLPRLKPARFRSQRQELAPTTTETPTDATAPYPASGWRPAGEPFTLPNEATTTESYGTSGPYPPSGWKPAGEPFTLPDQTDATPTDTYGPPGPYPPSGWKPAGPAFTLPQESTTGVPDTTYGPPSPSSEWIPDAQAFTLPQEQSTPDNMYGTPQSNTEGLDEPVEIQRSVGTYYVLLPNGQLQKVEFLTESDIQNMKYTARLELRDRAPLYVFGP